MAMAAAFIEIRSAANGGILKASPSFVHMPNDLLLVMRAEGMPGASIQARRRPLRLLWWVR
jgi:hypothetical protein